MSPDNVSTAVALLISVALTGCVRRDGRNSDCTWPDEPDAKTLHANQPDYAQHLSGDAEFAEELAIRYMDTHHGPRSGRFESHRAAGQAKNRCLSALFGEIGKSHHIPPEFLGRRSMAIDFAANLPFILLYGFSSGMLVLTAGLRSRLRIAV